VSDVLLEPLSLNKYAPIIGEEKVVEIKELAERLTGKSVCHPQTQLIIGFMIL
jgi:hypothetical protein